MKMVIYCVAYGCTNHQGSCEFGFHRFPADLSRREAWEAAIRRERRRANRRKPWRATEYSRLCGAHFVEGRVAS